METVSPLTRLVTLSGAFAKLKEKHSRIDARIFPNPSGSRKGQAKKGTGHRLVSCAIFGEP